MGALVDAVLERSTGMPLPGDGATIERFRRLSDCAALDPSLGRMIEAHTDAVAILAEADRRAPEGCCGVWAARGPDPCRLEGGRGRWRLRGTVPWCTGAGLVDHALVATDHESGPALVLVDMSAAGIERRAPSWRSIAFADTDTRAVSFDVSLADDDVVGLGGWYLSRAGFWHGAIGVAACWAGCATGLLRRVAPRWKDEPHGLAHLGAIDALTWELQTVLDASAVAIDAAPGDVGAAHRRALRVRHLVDVGVGEIVGRVERALGPAAMAMDDGVIESIAACDLYRRQCHAERDLEQLGRLAADER